MTVCVAAICDSGKALILVADKMVGVGYVEGEPNISKMRQLHKDWWVLFAGEDLSPVFDIIDDARTFLQGDNRVNGDQAPLASVKDAIQKGFEKKRLADAEALYLKTIGWTLERFNAVGHTTLPNAAQIQADIDRFSLPIELMVAGFDKGTAIIFDLWGYGEKRGIPNRCDIPGFHAIGSGSTVAEFMMYYRDFSPTETIREAVFHAIEAKYYGEQATGVGIRTDLFIVRQGHEMIKLDEEGTIEEKLVSICDDLTPGTFTKSHKKILNNLPELEGLPELPEKKKKTSAKKSPKPEFHQRADDYVNDSK